VIKRVQVKGAPCLLLLTYLRVMEPCLPCEITHSYLPPDAGEPLYLKHN